MHISALLLLCLTAAPAVAAPYATIEVEREPALLRATLIDVRAAQAADIVITADTGERVTASSVTPYARTAKPIAIAILYGGDEIFIGNEQHEPEGPTRFHGILDPLKAALDQPAFAAAFPAGSQLVALSYELDARVRHPLGPLVHFKSASLGVQRDYRGRLGRELASAIELALTELERATTPRRALIVISDGTDTDPETAKPRLALLKKRAAQAGIEVYGVIFKTTVSEDASVITTMIPAARVIRSTKGMDEAIANITAEIGHRSEATFPLAKLPRDGRAHELTIRVGYTVLDPVTVVLPGAPATDTCSCWLQLGICLGAGLLLALGLVVRARFARSKVAV